MYSMTVEHDGDLLRMVRESRRPKLTQRDVAKMLGVKEETYRSYEYGRSRFPLDLAKHLAAEWNVPFQSFYGDALPVPQPNLYVVETSPSYNLRPEPTGKVKIYGSASAGDGNAAEIDADSIEVPIQFARPDYGALIVDGDSMMPDLLPGDICIFKDHSLPKIDAVVAAELESGDWVIKRLEFERGNWSLCSVNERFEPLQGSFRISGLLVGLIRDDGPERTIRLNPYGLKL